MSHKDNKNQKQFDNQNNHNQNKDHQDKKLHKSQCGYAQNSDKNGNGGCGC